MCGSLITRDQCELKLETPEVIARKQIDTMLEAAGWSVQNINEYDFGASTGIAIREFSVGRDSADYLLFLNGKAAGVIEAKAEGTTLGGVSVQTVKYTTGLPSFVQCARARNVDEPNEKQLVEAYSILVEDACSLFKKRKVLDAILEAKKKNEQTIDTISRDEVLETAFDPASRGKAQGLVDEFNRMIEEKRHELDALQIIYNKPYRSRHLTYEAVKELAAAVDEPPMGLRQLWWAYNVLKRDRVRGARVDRLFADVIQLVRFALEEVEVLEPYGASVDRRFDSWLTRQEESGKVYHGEQLKWLKMIKNQIKSSVEVINDDFENVPFNQFGGLHKAHNLFGNNLGLILEELNLELNM